MGLLHPNHAGPIRSTHILAFRALSVNCGHRKIIPGGPGFLSGSALKTSGYGKFSTCVNGQIDGA
jgi:hypothetical protein